MFVELKKAFLGRAAGERIDVSEDDARQLIQQGTAVAVADDLIGPAVTRALDAALTRAGQSIDAAVNQSLKAFADARTLARKHAAPAIFGTGGEGDPHGKTFGDWCLAVARGDRAYLEKHYGSRFVEYAGKAALAEASGVTGGYTVPPDFYQQLMALMAEETFIRPRAFVVPMASASMQIPYLDVSTVQSAGVSPFFGGVQMYGTVEAQMCYIAGNLDTVAAGGDVRSVLPTRPCVGRVFSAESQPVGPRRSLPTRPRTRTRRSEVSIVTRRQAAEIRYAVALALPDACASRHSPALTRFTQKETVHNTNPCRWS
jgi:hypothetical protein